MAAMFSVVVVVVVNVCTMKSPDAWPCITVKVLGTCISKPVVLRVTVYPPDLARPFNSTVAMRSPPPVTDVFDNERPVK